MKLKIIPRLLRILMICIPLYSESQNLVQNSGFETPNRLPEKKGNSINRCKHWIAPIGGGDYYMKGTGRHTGTPRNIFGRQVPHSGIAYAGICLRTKFLEYAETTLSDTLKKDQEYLVEFYICKAERTIGSVKEFGVLFTTARTWGLKTRGIAQQPQVEFINPKGFKNKKEWVKLSAVYKAKGNEIVLILGHFNYNPADNKRKIFSHYYIDDVSVTPLDKQRDSIPTASTEEANPTAFTPQPGVTITLNNIYFETNNSTLLSPSFPSLDLLTKYMTENLHTSIVISGHTDSTGNEGQNKLLSEARAKAVAEYLMINGIDQQRISYVGYGSAKPIAGNDTEEGRQQNRRVDIAIYKIE